MTQQVEWDFEGPKNEVIFFFKCVGYKPGQKMDIAICWTIRLILKISDTLQMQSLLFR